MFWLLGGVFIFPVAIFAILYCGGVLFWSFREWFYGPPIFTRRKSHR